MKKKCQYVCKIVLTKIRGSNVLIPSTLFLYDDEVKPYIMDTMEAGDEVIITKMTYDDFVRQSLDHKKKR